MKRRHESDPRETTDLLDGTPARSIGFVMVIVMIGQTIGTASLSDRFLSNDTSLTDRKTVLDQKYNENHCFNIF